MNATLLGSDGVSASDRGLAFGDGLFETLLWQGGRLQWWPDHWARLATGCRLLNLPLPDEAALLEAIESEVAAFLHGGSTDRHADLVIKLIHTAGPSRRGYPRPALLEPTTRILVSQRPPSVVERFSHGVDVGLAGRPLAAGIPPLAGLKHLNRLPQVLARSAVPTDGTVFDLLQCDDAGRVLGGSASNLFWREDGRWHTPPVVGSMIAGTVRARLIRHLAARVEPLASGRMALCDAALLTNAVMGVVPIGRLADRALDPVPAQTVATAHADWQCRHGADRQLNPYTCWMSVASESVDLEHLKYSP